MKIEIEYDDKNIGFSFHDEEGNTLYFDDLSRDEQVKILNAFADGFNFWKRFLKEEEK